MTRFGRIFSKQSAPEEAVEGDGSPLRMESIFERYAKFVLRNVRRMGVSDADVEDVAQDVFMIVGRKLPTFDRGKSLTAWIFGIVRNEVSDYRKKAYRLRERSQTDRDAITVEAGQETDLLQRENRLLLDRALDRLDEDKRAVFVMYYLENLSMEQTAAVLGCPLQTAYSRLRAAREIVAFQVTQTQASDRTNERGIS